MEDAGNEISIKVTIGDRQYPLKINAAEEEIVRSAAKLINDKAKFYQENFSVKDKQDALAMASLEFATEMLSATQAKTSWQDETGNQIEHLQRLIDSALPNAG
ncbi:MAG: cell division protein ZapA [Flavobacteriales bacterium]|nr:cell division protein ZapA [Bacteroidota bacterium]MCB9241557.1 cell division protein ZapA [Flavobacteriales bacterium]